MIITLVTKILHNTFMNRFHVPLLMALCCKMIITLVTRIFYIFMNRYLVGLKISLCCKMIVKLVTRILYTFVMLLMIVLFWCLIPSIFTGLTNTFMFTTCVIIQTSHTYIISSHSSHLCNCLPGPSSSLPGKSRLINSSAISKILFPD